MSELISLRRGQRIVTTNSELNIFRSCRMRWVFEYRNLLRPKRARKPLSVGKCVHRGIASMYGSILAAQRTQAAIPSTDEMIARALRDMDEGLRSYLAELFERIEQGEDVEEIVEESKSFEEEAKGSVERFIAEFGDEDGRRYQVVAIERPFRTALLDERGTRRPRLTYSGVWDNVLYDPEIKDVVMGEHKTSGADARGAEKRLDLDPQTTGYVWTLGQVLKDHGAYSKGVFPRWLADELQGTNGFSRQGRMPVGRVFYNVVRKTGPKKPKWTKKTGDLSAAQVDTTRDVYEAMLVEQETDGAPRFDNDGNQIGRFPPKPRTDKQRERLDSLPGDSSKWVSRHEAYHSRDMIDRWRQEVLYEGRQLRLAIQGKLPPTRNPNHCNMPWSMACPYRSICIEDTPELRESEFKVVNDPHVEVVEAEEESEL